MYYSQESKEQVFLKRKNINFASTKRKVVGRRGECDTGIFARYFPEPGHHANVVMDVSSIMSRKRAAPSQEAPSTKRYLNAALAAELQNLRISKSQAPITSSDPNPFGVTNRPSPFLQPQLHRAYQPPVNQNVSFGSDFAHSLPPPENPTASTDEPDMVVEYDLTTPKRAESDIVVMNDDGMTSVEEYDEQENVNQENRVVVYRPPVRSPARHLATLNSRLPDGQYIFRNPRTQEWMFTNHHNERMKRKLALVPWRGDAKRQVLESFRTSPTAIPMPWYNTEEEIQSTPPVQSTAQASQEETMQIEELP